MQRLTQRYGQALMAPARRARTTNLLIRARVAQRARESKTRIPSHSGYLLHQREAPPTTNRRAGSGVLTEPIYVSLGSHGA